MTTTLGTSSAVAKLGWVGAGGERDDSFCSVGLPALAPVPQAAEFAVRVAQPLFSAGKRPLVEVSSHAALCPWSLFGFQGWTAL